MQTPGMWFLLVPDHDEDPHELAELLEGKLAAAQVQGGVAVQPMPDVRMLPDKAQTPTEDRPLVVFVDHMTPEGADEARYIVRRLPRPLGRTARGTYVGLMDAPAKRGDDLGAVKKWVAMALSEGEVAVSRIVKQAKDMGFSADQARRVINGPGYRQFPKSGTVMVELVE